MQREHVSGSDTLITFHANYCTRRLRMLPKNGGVFFHLFPFSLVMFQLGGLCLFYPVQKHKNHTGKNDHYS